MPSSDAVSTARENRRLLNKTDRIAERIECVERTLAPGSGYDLARWVAMHIARRETAELARAFMHRVNILDRKIDVVRIWPGLFVIRPRVDQGQYHRAAVEVMSKAPVNS